LLRQCHEKEKFSKAKVSSYNQLEGEAYYIINITKRPQGKEIRSQDEKKCLNAEGAQALKDICRHNVWLIYFIP